jgi:hypothetical protein
VDIAGGWARGGSTQRSEPTHRSTDTCTRAPGVSSSRVAPASEVVHEAAAAGDSEGERAGGPGPWQWARMDAGPVPDPAEEPVDGEPLLVTLLRQRPQLLEVA